jgi:hypothetical protein
MTPRLCEPLWAGSLQSPPWKATLPGPTPVRLEAEIRAQAGKLALESHKRWKMRREG